MSRIISGTQAAIFCSFNKCVYNTTAGNRNSFGCCNVNKGLQTKDGRDDFWKLFCEILFLKHSAAQEPWTKKRDGTIVYHDISD